MPSSPVIVVQASSSTHLSPAEQAPAAAAAEAEEAEGSTPVSPTSTARENETSNPIESGIRAVTIHSVVSVASTRDGQASSPSKQAAVRAASLPGDAADDAPARTDREESRRTTSVDFDSWARDITDRLTRLDKAVADVRDTSLEALAHSANKSSSGGGTDRRRTTFGSVTSPNTFQPGSVGGGLLSSMAAFSTSSPNGGLAARSIPSFFANRRVSVHPAGAPPSPAETPTAQEMSKVAGGTVGAASVGFQSSRSTMNSEGPLTRRVTTHVLRRPPPAPSSSHDEEEEEEEEAEEEAEKSSQKENDALSRVTSDPANVGNSDGASAENPLRAVPSRSVHSVSSNRIRKQPVQPKARARAITQEHPLIVTLDIVCIVSATMAACIPWHAVINGSDNFTPREHHVLVGLSVACSACNFVWIASRFFVAQCYGWEIVDLQEDIRRNYVRGWFRFDALIALPLDWIFLGWQYQIFYYCQLRQVLRLARIFTLQASVNPLVRSRMWISLLNQLSVIVVSLHVCAVIFSGEAGLDYIEGLYWAATTASSVGYGDVLPGKAVGDRIYAIFVMFLGLVIVASLTGFVTSLFTMRDALQEKIDAKKQMLASMLAYYEIPWEVQVEVISMFPAVIDGENQSAFKKLIEDLPTFLIEKIEGYTRARALATAIPLFESCPVSVRLEVAKRLVHRFYQANEPIIVAGEEGYEMYFLVRGVADVIVTLPNGDNLVVATLRSGTFFGELALVSDSVKRTASIVPVTPSEVLVLSKQNFDELGDEYTQVREVFEAVIEEAQARLRSNKK